jgi:hypothetical protein
LIGLFITFNLPNFAALTHIFVTVESNIVLVEIEGKYLILFLLDIQCGVMELERLHYRVSYCLERARFYNNNNVFS